MWLLFPHQGDPETFLGGDSGQDEVSRGPGGLSQSIKPL